MREIENFILSELGELGLEKNDAGTVTEKLEGEALEKELCRLLLSHKFRKYSAPDITKERIQNVVHIAVSQNKPVNICSLQGSYKLWRLPQAPEPDWAELFMLMYYTLWLKPICALHKPGAVLDFFVDDIIMERIDNYTREEVTAYNNTLQGLMDFLKPYAPKNLKYSINTVSSYWESEEAFWSAVDKEVEKWEAPENIKLNEEEIARIEVNCRLLPGQDNDPLWREKNARYHDAYLFNVKRKSPHHPRNRTDVIPVLTLPIPNGAYLVLGSTKNSIMKHWFGFGVLKQEGDKLVPTVISSGQLEKYDSKIYPVSIPKLKGKNFVEIHVVSAKG